MCALPFTPFNDHWSLAESVSLHRLQAVVMVIDSSGMMAPCRASASFRQLLSSSGRCLPSDRERLNIVKSELYTVLSHQVCSPSMAWLSGISFPLVTADATPATAPDTVCCVRCRCQLPPSAGVAPALEALTCWCYCEIKLKIGLAQRGSMCFCEQAGDAL